MVTITAYPRVHLGLVDCGRATLRKYGGAGFAVRAFPTVVSAEPASRTSFKGFGAVDERGRADVEAALTRLSDVTALRRLRLHLVSAAPQHVGMGSKTTLLLAVLEAACRASGVRLPRGELQRLSGRGGTSGVGISSFYRGGLVVDQGQPREAGDELKPSSAEVPRVVPPAHVRVPMPRRWSVVLLLPRAKGASGEAESTFFARHTPIPDTDVAATLALLYHGILPAVTESSLPAFGRALAAFQSVGFKRREIAAQPTSVLDLLDELTSEHGVAAGLSSMGPLVFAVVAARDSSALGAVRALCGRHRCNLAVCEPQNRGYELSR